MGPSPHSRPHIWPIKWKRSLWRIKNIVLPASLISKTFCLRYLVEREMSWLYCSLVQCNIIFGVSSFQQVGIIETSCNINLIPGWLGLNILWFLLVKDRFVLLSWLNSIHSLRVGWRNLVQVSLIFVIIVSFMLFNVFPLVYVLYFEEFLIHDSHGFMILKKIWPNLLGLCHFPLNT